MGWLFPSEIEILLKETGFDCKLTQKQKLGDEAVNSIFFSYQEVTNSKNTTNYIQEPAKNLYVVTVVVVFVIFILLATNNENYLSTSQNSVVELYAGIATWVIIIASFVFYRTFVLKKMITLQTHAGGHFSVFKNTEGEKIIAEIIAKRNASIRKKYV